MKTKIRSKMRKDYFLLLAATAAFAACTSNDTFKEIVDEDVTIGFNGVYVGNNTRAEISTDWMQQDGKQFGVYGYKTLNNTTTDLFINEPVTYSGTTSDWTHPTVRFWDKGAENAYNFYAYAPYKNDGTMTWTSTGFQFTNIPIIKKIDPTTTSDADDIVVATAQEGFDYADCASQHTSASLNHSNHEGFVPFTFNHILSKLCFQVKTNISKKSAVFTVKKIEIDFPSMKSGKSVSWTQGAKNNVTTGVTAYGTAADDYVNKDGTWDNDLVIYDNATGFEVGSTASGTGLAEYIVTPINSTVTKHAFAVKVTYDVQYKQIKEASKNKPSPEYPDDYEDTPNGLEAGCIATGLIDTRVDDNGTPDNTSDDLVVPVYTPGCNDKWIFTIDIEPGRINFCVNMVNGWDESADFEKTVEVN